jgi:hypothetical protein
MLDGRTAVLLQKINEWCADGKYKVLEREDFLSAFPAYLQEEEGVDGMLSYLAEHEYIDIQYSDRERGVYCLYPLPAGRLYAERIHESLEEKRSALRKNLLVSFLGGLAGALVGSGVVAAVALWV